MSKANSLKDLLLSQMGSADIGQDAQVNLGGPQTAFLLSQDDTSVMLRLTSSTGYVAVRKWDGTVTVYGDGVAATSHNADQAVPASGAWSKSAPKPVFAWPCTAANAAKSGTLTQLSSNSSNLIVLDVSGCPNLSILEIRDNQITQLDVSLCAALTAIYANNLTLRELDVSGLANLATLELYNTPSLMRVNCSGCSNLNLFNAGNCGISVIDLEGCSGIETLDLSINNLTNIDLSSCVAIINLFIYGNDLVGSLDVSGMSALATLDAKNNEGLTHVIVNGSGGNASLESIVLNNCNISDALLIFPTTAYVPTAMRNNASGYASLILSDNNLSAAAINALFGVLPIITGATPVNLDLNPGSATATQALLPANWVLTI